MSNFVSSNDAQELFEALGQKKLTVTDVMPSAASAANEGIPYLYLGATTQDFSNGSIYKCQEVTPATDPKTYEFVEIYVSNVDLSKYKRIWGGTEAAWEQLTDAEKAQYEYTFFEGDGGYSIRSIVVAETAANETYEQQLRSLAEVFNLQLNDSMKLRTKLYDSGTHRFYNLQNIAGVYSFVVAFTGGNTLIVDSLSIAGYTRKQYNSGTSQDLSSQVNTGKLQLLLN